MSKADKMQQSDWITLRNVGHGAIRYRGRDHAPGAEFAVRREDLPSLAGLMTERIERAPGGETGYRTVPPSLVNPIEYDRMLSEQEAAALREAEQKAAAEREQEALRREGNKRRTSSLVAGMVTAARARHGQALDMIERNRARIAWFRGEGADPRRAAELAALEGALLRGVAEAKAALDIAEQRLSAEQKHNGNSPPKAA